MIWASWSDFFAMGGYGVYIWGSVLVTFGALAIEVVSVKLRNTSIQRELRHSYKYKAQGKPSGNDLKQEHRQKNQQGHQQ